MTTMQFRILNLLGVLCAAMILTGLVLGRTNGALNESVSLTQNRFQPQFNEAQQKYGTLQNLAIRVAHGGQTNAVLKEILTKLDLQVTLPSEGQKK